MRVVYERGLGLDVHKKTVVACVLITPETGEVQRHREDLLDHDGWALSSGRLVGEPEDSR